MPRRLIQLLLGLSLYGVSLALMVRANLGLDPWDVFHQGLAQRLGWSLGTVVNVVGALVLLWIFLRQRPGVGTVANIFVLGTVADAVLGLLPPVTALPLRALLLISGVLLNALATAAYIGAGLGPGPRDGLMTGLVRRTGRPVGWVRTSIEVTVLAVGWLLGGSVGLGTLAYALMIGPLVQVLLPLLTVPEAQPTAQTARSDG
ncbi:membrane protein YczE [Deinococcus rubellus]|uniref:Membrane protein n=1 Tax=Deinococcus rubellus TaxID=1889240 RepID=A0ABY5YGK7_9DEIO|nr:membrane protein [Deinococcus rubellus]UWX63970.1 membrane protein [Deinococcus rubellus]